MRYAGLCAIGFVLGIMLTIIAGWLLCELVWRDAYPAFLDTILDWIDRLWRVVDRRLRR